jgi:hypothetical protein
MTFRFRFVSRDWARPGSVTGTRVETKFCPRARLPALSDERIKATSSYVDLMVGLKVFSSVELSKKGSAIVTKLVVSFLVDSKRTDQTNHKEFINHAIL